MIFLLFKTNDRDTFHRKTRDSLKFRVSRFISSTGSHERNCSGTVTSGPQPFASLMIIDAPPPRVNAAVLNVVCQVVGCVVRSCDVTTYPPKLALSLDVAGKTKEMGGTVAADEVSQLTRETDRRCKYRTSNGIRCVFSF